jgi:predicted MFS family arabinose efflux permease
LKRSLPVQVTAFILIRIVMSTAYRMVYPFLPVFARGLGVDLNALSLALSARSLVGMFGPFFAGFSDSRGRRAGMVLGLLIFTAGAALMVIWPGYLALTLALIFMLFGNLIIVPSMHAVVSDQVPYERRGLVLAITEFSWSLAFILGVPAVGVLIALYGWQAPFPILTLLGLASIGLVSWLAPKTPRRASSDGALAKLWQVFTYRPAVAGLILGLALSAANENVNVMLGVWMEDAFKLQIAALGAASAIVGLSELGGEGLVTGLVDRLGKARSVALGVGFNCLAALALPFLGFHLTAALAGLFFFYLTFEFTIVSSLPLITEVMPASRATMMAAFLAAASAGRAIGDLAALPVYRFSLFANPMLGVAGLAVAFNVLALLALRSVKIATPRI